MIRLVGVELLKLRTTRRALLGWLAVVVALVGLAATGAAFTPVEAGGDVVTVSEVVGAAWLAAIVGLLLGIIAATNEWRHGTSSVTFLVTPTRWPVVGAKLVSSAIMGVLLTTIGIALAAVIAFAVLTGRDLPVELDGAAWTEIAQMVVAAAMAGALGSAIGSLVQAQVPALVVTVGWFLIAEPLVAVLSDLIGIGEISDYLPASAFTAVDRTNEGDWGYGAAAAAAYLLVFGAAAVERTRRRDIT